MNDPHLLHPRALIVLGMHRSGTSVLTGSLEAAGVDLGTVNNAAPSNLKGNKENVSIRDLNDRLYAAAGASWKSPPTSQLPWLPEVRERAAEIAAEYRARGRTWGFKDPRTVFTVESWLELLPEASLISTFRHPAAVAKSLAARPIELALTEDAGLTLWADYNEELLQLHGQHRFPVLEFTGDAAYCARLNDLLRGLQLDEPSPPFFEPRLVNQTHQGRGAEASGDPDFSREFPDLQESLVQRVTDVFRELRSRSKA